MITPIQCRAARAILDWSRQDLADVSKVSTSAIADFEVGKHKLVENNNKAIQHTFEMQNLVFAYNSVGWQVKERMDSYVFRRVNAARDKYDKNKGSADPKWEDLTLEYRTLLIQEEPA